MEYRILPKTDWKISEISFGCMSLSIEQRAEGREQRVGSKEQGTGNKDQGSGAKARGFGSDLPANFKTNQRLLHQAIDLGINYFDTADLYHQGQNELTVGKALQEKRQQIYLATKVGNQFRPDGSGWDWNPSKSYILKAVEDSLKRLQTDYIDLYQLHGGTIEDPIDETIEAFELLQEQGKIRAYGISSIRPNVIREYTKRSNLVSVMMQYSLLDRRPEESVLPLLAANNIAVMVRGAVAKGLLVDKPVKEYLEYSVEEVGKMKRTVEQMAALSSDRPGSRSQVAGLQGPRSKDEGRRIKDEGTGVRSEGAESKDQGTVMRGKSAGSNITLARVAIQFALRAPAVCSVVAGIRTVDQLAENAGHSEARLSAQEYKHLQSTLTPNKYQAHR